MSVMQLFNLKGRTALVTGGSRGLGLQMAQALGEAGARVLLVSRKAEELEHAAQHLQQQGIDAIWEAVNLSDVQATQNLATTAIERLGHIDILVNNAGATWGELAENHPLEAWDKVMDLNVRSIFVLSQAVGRDNMIPRKQGSIINVASIAGLRGNRRGDMHTIAYNTSKAAVINFTRALAGEWGIHGIRVNALAPGFFPSRMTKGLLAANGEERMASLAPLNRLGGEEDLMGAALLFASDAGRHITGQVLAVDGGVSAIL